MNRGSVFDSIESAQSFLGLLSETVNEVKQEVDCEVEQALDSNLPRRLQALRLLSYNLEKLALHMKKSCRILNDLRCLRRLLYEERAATRAMAKTRPAKITPELTLAIRPGVTPGDPPVGPGGTLAA